MSNVLKSVKIFGLSRVRIFVCLDQVVIVGGGGLACLDIRYQTKNTIAEGRIIHFLVVGSSDKNTGMCRPLPGFRHFKLHRTRSHSGPASCRGVRRRRTAGAPARPRRTCKTTRSPEPRMHILWLNFAWRINTSPSQVCRQTHCFDDTIN